MNRRHAFRSTLKISRAFTLLEMLVVIVILALVAQTAMLAIDATVDSERRAATVTTLENLERAIVGRKGVLDPSGRVWIEGFVADIGRLPRLQDGKLSELWVKPAALPSYSLQPIVGSDLLPNEPVAAGWRGPYLRLPLGDATLTDGWARSFVYVEDVLGGKLRIESFGADGVNDATGSAAEIDDDLALGLQLKDYCGVFLVDWTPKQATDEVCVELWRTHEGVVTAQKTEPAWRAGNSPPVEFGLNKDDPERRNTIGHHIVVFAVRDALTDVLKKPAEKRAIVVVPMGVVGGDPVFHTELP